MIRAGIPIVLSAASGTGKTTLGQRLLTTCPGITLSVSYTTRPPRQGEIHGMDYHFIDTNQFEEMVRAKAFMEWAEVHGNLYGTAWSEVSNRLTGGQDVLLDIDVQGGQEIRRAYPNALSIFLLPPSLTELRRRLRSRGTESEAQFQKRMLNARREIEAAVHYDYLVINDDIEHAVLTLTHIVQVERVRRADKDAIVRQILADDRDD